MYAYVYNYFKVKVDDEIPNFIKIYTQVDFELYSFLNSLRSIKYEHPFDYDVGIDIEDIRNKDLLNINTSIAQVVNKYSFLGSIWFELKEDIKNNKFIVNLNIILNEPSSIGKELIGGIELNG